MLTNRELSRCEARLGPVALFMPTKPEGEYKLDLRAFADRQIVTLLLGKCHSTVRGSHEIDLAPCEMVCAHRLLSVDESAGAKNDGSASSSGDLSEGASVGVVATATSLSSTRHK